MGRRLGQHFLADYRTAQKIAEVAGITPDDRVLEIGGGRGALTEHLVGRGARLVVVELDEPLAEGLAERFGPAAQVETGDILDVTLATLGAGRPWVVVGNLPYYVTSDIIVWLCDHRHELERALIMVQAEVAERLAATPGTEAWGRLSVLVQYHAEVELKLRVPPGAFRPPPKVNSAVVQLRFREQPAVAVADEARFFALVEHGFRWRRKTLASVLRRWRGWTAEQAVEALSAAGIDPQRRAETLSLDELARLSDGIGR